MRNSKYGDKNREYFIYDFQDPGAFNGINETREGISDGVVSSVRDHVGSIFQLELSRSRVANLQDDNKKPIEEQLTNFLTTNLFDSKILASESVSYVTVTNPHTRMYDTGAKLGAWSKEDHEIWDNIWMGYGSRSTNAGKLFREMKSLNEGQIAFIKNWKNKDSLIISEETRCLNIERALVVPLRFSGKIVGFFVHGIDYNDNRYVQDDDSTVSLAPYAWLTYYASQYVLLPALLTFYQLKSDDQYSRSIIHLIHQIAIDAADQVRNEVLEPINSMVDVPQNIQSQLLNICNSTREIPLSIYRLANDFEPLPHEKNELLDKESFLKLLDSIREDLELNPSRSPNTSVDIDCKRVPERMKLEGKAVVRRILREIMFNCVWAINERANELDSMEENFLGKIDVSISVEKKENNAVDEYILKVSNNGIKLPKKAESRVLRLGYSTRQNGTGMGLSIVSINASFLGGEIVAIRSLNPEYGVQIIVSLGEVDEQ